MWASQNRAQKLFFVIVRGKSSFLTSLLEMELKYFFHEQHSLHNIEVLGLPTKHSRALSDLYYEVTNRAPGSWMVDELIMPKNKKHQQWGEALWRLQSHIESVVENPLLWISIAGIKGGEVEHFKAL